MTETMKDKSMIPIGGTSVVDTTIKRIVDAIREGRFKRGQKLPNEYELISELQISRNSLREAMRVLVTVGVVEIKRGDGTYVCDQIKPSIIDNMIYGLVFDTSSIAELIELRQSLDEIMLKLAIDKATEDDVKELRAYIDEMSKSFLIGDYDAAANADYNFHIKLVEASRNTFLDRIVKGIYQLFRHSIQESLTTEEEHAHAVEYHNNLLNLIITKDKAKVSEVVADTLENWQNHIKQ